MKFKLDRTEPKIRHTKEGKTKRTEGPKDDRWTKFQMDRRTDRRKSKTDGWTAKRQTEKKGRWSR